MIFDVIHAVLQVAKPLRQVHLEQVPQQILQVGAKVRGKSYLQERKKKGALNYRARSTQTHGCFHPFNITCLVTVYKEQ